MKKIFLSAIAFFLFIVSKGQSVGIGNNTPAGSAILDLTNAQNKGLLIPSMTTGQKNGIGSPANGLLIYQTDSAKGFYFFDGLLWRRTGEGGNAWIENDSAVYTSKKVGIGTGKPVATLHIQGDINSSIRSNATNSSPSAAQTKTWSCGTSITFLAGDSTGIVSGACSNTASTSSFTTIPIADNAYIEVTVQSFSGYGLTITTQSPDAQCLEFAQGSFNIGGAYLPGVVGQKYLFRGRGMSFRLWTNNAGGGSTSATILFKRVYLDSAGYFPANTLLTGNLFHFDPLNGSLISGLRSGAIVRGDNSIAAGTNTKAQGNSASAFGSNTSASGASSLATGVNSLAEGNFSTAIGYKTWAQEEFAVAIGLNNRASGWRSISLGDETTTYGRNSLAVGYTSTAFGDFSTAMGFSNFSGGIYSLALGYENVADGDYSMVMGNSSSANGDHSLAMGNEATADGDHSVVMGNSSTATGNFSLAMGYSSNAGGAYSTTTGRNNIAEGFSSFVTGLYNDPIVSTQTSVSAETPLFIVGNGSSSTRSNAVVVRKDGRVGIGTNSPATTLNIGSGSDASYADNSGYLVLGDVGGTNIVFDNNEIIARNNGASATLVFQNNGGNITMCGSSGNVGIGTSGTHQLRLSLDDAAKPTTNTWSAISDGRLKTNVQDYKEGLKELMQIRPVWFTYTGEANMPKETGVGVIAQELQQTSPYMVSTWNYKDEKGNNTSYLAVNNGAMTYMLINAVKEQQQQIDQLKKLVEELLKNKEEK